MGVSVCGCTMRGWRSTSGLKKARLCGLSLSRVNALHLADFFSARSTLSRRGQLSLSAANSLSAPPTLSRRCPLYLTAVNSISAPRTLSNRRSLSPPVSSLSPAQSPRGARSLIFMRLSFDTPFMTAPLRALSLEPSRVSAAHTYVFVRGRMDQSHQSRNGGL